MKHDRDRIRDWRERAARTYRDRVREEVLSGERGWNSVPKENRERKKRREEAGEVYGDKMAWISRRGCLLWDRPDHVCRPGTVVGHHVRSVGAGGDDSATVPLCILAHRQVHQQGRQTFEERTGLDLNAEAAVYEAMWRKEREG